MDTVFVLVKFYWSMKCKKSGKHGLRVQDAGRAEAWRWRQGRGAGPLRASPSSCTTGTGQGWRQHLPCNTASGSPLTTLQTGRPFSILQRRPSTQGQQGERLAQGHAESGVESRPAAPRPPVSFLSCMGCGGGASAPH